MSAVRNVQRLVANLRWICPSRKMRDGTNVQVESPFKTNCNKDLVKVWMEMSHLDYCSNNFLHVVDFKPKPKMLTLSR